MEKLLRLIRSFFNSHSYNYKTCHRITGITHSPLYTSYVEPILKSMSNQDLSTDQIIQHLKQFNSMTFHRDLTLKRNKSTFQQNIYSDTNQNHSKNSGYCSFSQHCNQSALLELYKTEVPKIFGDIAWFILKINSKSNVPQIPIFYSGKNKRIDLKKEEVLYIMCLMAFNLIPSQTYMGKKQHFNRYNNFFYIFSNNHYKTQCIVEYFKKFLAGRQILNPNSFLTIRRQVQTTNIFSIIESMKNKKLCEVIFQHQDKSIEDFTNSIKIDFSNKFIGGGALGNGSLQEQIMFANHPELYVAILICQQMKSNEALFFSGFKKYFKNKKYGFQTEFDGQEIHISKTDYIVAIDAINFKDREMNQFNQKFIDREILKAYVGFNVEESAHIATGNWGCGAFAGNISLKFLIQWIACSLAGKKMIYCPYRSNHVMNYKNFLIQKIQKQQTIGSLYSSLLQKSYKITGSQQNIIDKMQVASHKTRVDNLQNKKFDVQCSQNCEQLKKKSGQKKPNKFMNTISIFIFLILLIFVCYYLCTNFRAFKFPQNQIISKYKYRKWG